MRVTYRRQDTKRYWEERWDALPVDAPAENPSVYPLRFAEMAVAPGGRILEAGCGNGRILRYYKDRGHDILGMDYVQSSIDKLRAADPELEVECGDIRALRHEDGSFRYVLAFGLYHSLPPEEIEGALRETLRVMEPGGRLCASCRADNLHNRLIDRRGDRRRAADGGELHFHKVNLTRRELVRLFEKAGFEVETVHAVENMPFLYKFRLFRARGHKAFDESLGRREGYRLSLLGRAVQGILMGLFPAHFCNVNVVLARRPA